MSLGRYGITVNAVAPGFIETDMASDAAANISASAWAAEHSMLGRTGQPADIANAVAFLASKEAAFITGQVLTVDGGRMDYIGHS